MTSERREQLKERISSVLAKDRFYASVMMDELAEKIMLEIDKEKEENPQQDQPQPGPGPYGKHLTCPSCDGSSFFMYRSNIHGDDQPQEIADCIDCHTSTYASALKSQYHDDKGIDFAIIGQDNISITFECQECGNQFDDKTAYKQTVYDNTIYHDIDPEPVWNCPDHPQSTCNLLISDLDEDK